VDPDPAISVIDLQYHKQNTNFKKSFSAYYFLKIPVPVHVIYINFQDKKSKRSHKTVGIKVFLTISA
jgi:hypothetical protein